MFGSFLINSVSVADSKTQTREHWLDVQKPYFDEHIHMEPQKTGTSNKSSTKRSLHIGGFRYNFYSVLWGPTRRISRPSLGSSRRKKCAGGQVLGGFSKYTLCILFEIDCAIFLHKFTWIVVSVHKLNKLGKFWSIAEYHVKLWLIWKKFTTIS